MISLSHEVSEKKHILWDWNGTLLNDVDLCVSIVNGFLAERSLPPIDRDAYRQRFCFPVIEYYKGLGFDFSKESFEEITVKFVARYAEGVANCSLFTGAKELLCQLDTQQKSQSVLSAAREMELLHLLEKHDIRSFFEHVYGLSDHYARGKVERGKELISQLGIHKKDIVLIGDTDHDVEVAHALGIDVIVLADGHQGIERFHAHKEKANVVSCRYAHAKKFPPNRP